MMNQREDSSYVRAGLRGPTSGFQKELSLEPILEGGNAIVVPYLLDERDDIYLTVGTLDPTE